MAFARTDLPYWQPIANSGRGKAPCEYAFRTTDELTTVDGSGYFNYLSDMLEIGDLIFVTVVDDRDTPTSVSAVGILTVVSNASGVVDTSDALQGGGGGTGSGSVPVYLHLSNVSSAGQVYSIAPITGNISAVYSVISGDITGDDAVLTVKSPDGTVGTITITHSGTVTGDVDSITSPAHTEVEVGEAIEVETDGGSTGAVAVTILVLITPSVVDSD